MRSWLQTQGPGTLRPCVCEHRPMGGARARPAAALAAFAAAAAAGGCGAAAPDERPAADVAVPAASRQAQAPRFVTLLRRGGNVLVFRHAATDPSQADAQRFRYTQCSRQRNLDDRGRAQARAIGRAVRVMRVPIGRVLASPYCRTVQTARIAFGRVTPTRDLLSTI